METKTQKYQTTFDRIPVEYTFSYNGQLWQKRSTRTAHILKPEEYRGNWFYFAGLDKVTLTFPVGTDVEKTLRQWDSRLAAQIREARGAAKTREPMMLLVDSRHGVYTYDTLVKTYPLFMAEDDKYIPLLDWMSSRADFDGETPETVFHPDTENWSENVDCIEYRNQLCIKTNAGEYWQVQSIDGDIWAINPSAEWSDETEEYYIPEDK